MTKPSIVCNGATVFSAGKVVIQQPEGLQFQPRSLYSGNATVLEHDTEPQIVSDALALVC